MFYFIVFTYSVIFVVATTAPAQCMCCSFFCEASIVLEITVLDFFPGNTIVPPVDMSFDKFLLLRPVFSENNRDMELLSYTVPRLPILFSSYDMSSIYKT